MAITASIKKLGIQGLGVDFVINKAAKSPLIRIDLTCSSGQELLWNILRRKDICGVHLAPPCGTASRAREIRRRKGPSPRPLRSNRFPDGIPKLRGTDRIRVQKANVLYRLTDRRSGSILHLKLHQCQC